MTGLIEGGAYYFMSGEAYAGEMAQIKFLFIDSCFFLLNFACLFLFTYDCRMTV